MDKLLSGRNIIIIEDEMLILMMIADMLADLGCESVSVASKIGHPNIPRETPAAAIPMIASEASRSRELRARRFNRQAFRYP